jgi:zinc ribbon protein
VFCNYCAAVNPDDSLFCSACGRSIPPRSRGSEAIEVKSPVTDQNTVPTPVASVSPNKPEKYQAVYSQMSDDELTRLGGDIGSLTESARAALLAELRTRNLPDTPNQAASSKPASPDKALYGVHGWLAWFVFALLVIGPISTAVSIVNEYDITKTPGVDGGWPTLTLK